MDMLLNKSGTPTTTTQGKPHGEVQWVWQAAAVECQEGALEDRKWDIMGIEDGGANTWGQIYLALLSFFHSSIS